MKRFFRLGVPTIIALVIAAAILLFFATPLTYAVETDSSDFDSLTMFSCEAEDGEASFTLPEGSFFEKLTVKLHDLDEGEEPLKDISQVELVNDSSLFMIAGTNIRVSGSSAYIIVTGYRQALLTGSMESYGFAVHIKGR